MLEGKQEHARAALRYAVMIPARQDLAVGSQLLGQDLECPALLDQSRQLLAGLDLIRCFARFGLKGRMIEGKQEKFSTAWGNATLAPAHQGFSINAQRGG